MFFLVFVVMIVIIICLIDSNTNLKKENKNLKERFSGKINFCPGCGYDLRNYGNNRVSTNVVENNININNYNSVSVDSNYVNSNNYNNVDNKVKYTDKEIKNSLILIVGSILIILSAIVFLTSTWNIVHNIVKTGVILLMLLVFLAVSYVADKYLKLKQTSKTFYYIALAYIPIILLSIAMFSLFGKYFSLYGLGRYIYLTISCVLVSLIYYYNAKKKDSKLIFIFSIIFQMLSVIFLVLIFTTNSSIVLMGVLLYSIVINLLYIGNKFCFNSNIHLKLSNVLSISTAIIVGSNNLFNIIDNDVLIVDLLLFGLMYINVYIMLNKILVNKNIYNYCYPLLIMFMFYNLTFLFENLIVRQLLMVLSFVVIYIYNLIKENKINIVTYIEIFSSFVILNFIWFSQTIFDNKLLDNYILFSLFTFLSVINYLFDDKYKKFSSYMVTAGMMISILFLCSDLVLNPAIFGFVALSLIISYMIINKIEINLRNSFKWIGIISLGLFVLLNEDITIWSILIYIIYFVSCFLYNFKTKEIIFKILSYIYVNVSLFTLLFYLDVNFEYFLYVIPASTIIFTFIEILLNNRRSDVSDIYLIVQYVLSFILLNIDFNIYRFILMLIINIMFIIYINYSNKNKNYLYISFVSMIPYLYISNILVINSINIMYYLSVMMLVLLCMFIYTKRDNIYIFMFYLYSIMHICCLEEFKYVSILILLVGSVLSYLIKENKVKDMFKALIYTLCLVLYNFIIDDLNIDNNAVLCYGIYFVFTLLITRDILKKYDVEYKIWEYISCIIINLVAFANYLSEFDGIMFVMFLTVIVIFSYIKRYGPVFIICLLSILMNVLLLTRTFWLSIPWWIYILVVGSVLVGFAIYNEVKDKNNDNTSKDKVNDFKKYLDL